MHFLIQILRYTENDAVLIFLVIHCIDLRTHGNNFVLKINPQLVTGGFLYVLVFVVI